MRSKVNPFLPSGLFYLNSFDQSISGLRGVWSVFITPCFIKMPVINANSVDPDQTPRSTTSDLGLHCLPMSHLWDARHKWVKAMLLKTIGHICFVCFVVVFFQRK